MGMAASQARYLGLTARKTNVEYEGQQVNQQRTALSNQSANLFNQLMTLQVPTPPSTTDFTTLQYSYNDGYTDEVITKFQQLGTTDPDYNYIVTHYHYEDVYTGVEKMSNNPQVQGDDKIVKGSQSNPNVVYDNVNNKYTVDGKEVFQYDPADPKQKDLLDKIKAEQPGSNVGKETSDANVYFYKDANNVMHFATKGDLDNSVANPGNNLENCYSEYTPTYVGNSELKKYDPSDPIQKAAVDQIKNDLKDSVFAKSPNGEIYTYESAGKTYFACKSDLTRSMASYEDPTKPIENQVKLPYYSAVDLKTKIEKTEKALLEDDGSGRFTSVRYENSSASYTLNTETTTDNNAYQDAMNQYNYNIRSYEQNIQDINSQTEIIQQEDRTLELRLKQLDTEQEALQTEMEAVKKVIDKNIEQTFKTFN